MNNTFLHKLAIIIYNIDAEVMYSEIFPSLQKVFRLKGLNELIRLTRITNGLFSPPRQAKIQLPCLSTTPSKIAILQILTRTNDQDVAQNLTSIPPFLTIPQ